MGLRFEPSLFAEGGSTLKRWATQTLQRDTAADVHDMRHATCDRRQATCETPYDDDDGAWSARLSILYIYTWNTMWGPYFMVYHFYDASFATYGTEYLSLGILILPDAR